MKEIRSERWQDEWEDADKLVSHLEKVCEQYGLRLEARQ